MADRYDWVEIIEPRSGDHMFANLKSGQCLWEPPEGATVKATSDNQWWELYDSNTRRYYYYNSATQKTVWRKPKEADIIALAKLQLLKAKEAKYADKSSIKSKSKSRQREGSISKTKPIIDAKESGGNDKANGDNILSSIDNVKPLSKVEEDDSHDYVNVSFDSEIKYDVSIVKSIPSQRKPSVTSKEPVTRTFSLDDNAETEEVQGRHTKWMSVRDHKEIQKSKNAETPKFEISSLPTPEDESVGSGSVAVPGGPKRAPPKPPRGSVSPAKSPRKFSMDSQLREGLAQQGKATETPSADDNENGVDDDHVYDEFDQQIDNGDCLNDQNGRRKDTLGRTIERPVRPPPPTPSGYHTLPNPKRKMPEPYTSQHTHASYESGSLSRNIKLALEKKDESYRVLSTDEESNGGSLSPLSQLMADVQGYNPDTSTKGFGSQEELVNARSEKSNAEPTAPSGTLSDEGRAHYVSVYDNVDDDNHSPTSGQDNVEGIAHSKVPSVPPPPPPPPHGAVYETIPSEPSQLEVSVAERLASSGMPKSTAALVDACEVNFKTPLTIGPQERRVLTRSKSDRVVTRTQSVAARQQHGKERSPGSSFRPTSMMPFRKPSLNKSLSASLNASQIKEAVPLSTHRKGLFRRRMSIASMLSWSKTPIRKPMVLTRDRQLKKDAVDVFKLILQYMGDKTTRKNVQGIGLDIVCKGWSTAGLRDEIYVQLCKQTTENFKEASLQRGWELMCMCLAMFPTSNKFHSYLEGYIYRHLDPDNNDSEVPLEAYAKHCYKQLERICGTGAKRGNKKPTAEELEQAKQMVFNPSMFGNTLEDIMELQSERYPERRLPWIMTTLADTVVHSNALHTEGIFRVPGDIDEVNMLKVHVDKWKEVTKTYEPHVPASLLKLWFRDLHEPLIPQAFYDGCIHNCEDPTVTLGIVYSLPELNHWVFGFLVHFLQRFMAPTVSKVTLMDENNLAMVWAPNCLRCPSDDPMEILESTRKEMAFLRTVIRNWDTSFLNGVL